MFLKLLLEDIFKNKNYFTIIQTNHQVRKPIIKVGAQVFLNKILYLEAVER